MPRANLPTPQYINWEDNVEPYIGQEKILVSDTARTAISFSQVNGLIAQGEGLVLAALSPYFVTVPSLLTTDNRSWENLPNYVYSNIYSMFVIASALKIVGNFINTNTGLEDTTLSFYLKFYKEEKAKYEELLETLLSNGSYRYQFEGLKPLGTGIPRAPATYAMCGGIGGYDYTIDQMTDPKRNFGADWGFEND